MIDAPTTTAATTDAATDDATTRAPSWAVVAARSAAQLYLAVLVLLAICAALPLVWGWTPLAVISGSMEPAISTGSVVVLSPVDEDEFYAHPSVIAFHDLSGGGHLVTHRIIDTQPGPDGPVYTTQGDANPHPDSTPVPHDAVIGPVRMVVPFIGLPARWVHSQQWLPLAMTAAITVAAVLVLTRRPEMS